MRTTKIIALGLLGMTFSCTNPNSEYIKKVKDLVKENANGVELNYENIDFQWTDTLFVKEKLANLNTVYKDGLNTILEIEYSVKDNFKKGNIFSLNYITKDRFTELRNWEIKVAHPNEYSYGGKASWVKDGYKDYYDFAFANRDASPWISELCIQIEETDSLIRDYDKLEEGNLDLLKNVNWFYKRIDNYWSNNKPSELWDKVDNEILKLSHLKTEIDSLSKVEPNNVIYFKALNTYKINNPILNGAEQELKKYFLFNSKLEIIGEEDIER